MAADHDEIAGFEQFGEFFLVDLFDVDATFKRRELFAQEIDRFFNGSLCRRRRIIADQACKRPADGWIALSNALIVARPWLDADFRRNTLRFCAMSALLLGKGGALEAGRDGRDTIPAAEISRSLPGGKGCHTSELPYRAGSSRIRGGKAIWRRCFGGEDLPLRADCYDRVGAMVVASSRINPARMGSPS